MKREIAMKTGLMSGWNLIGSVISFAFTLLVANGLGPAGYGLFALTMAVFEVLLVAFYVFGLAGTKYIAENGLSSVAKKLIVIEIVIGIVLAVIVFVCADSIAAWLGKPIAGYLRIVAAALLVRPFYETIRSVYLGVKKMRWYVAVEAVTFTGKLALAAIALFLGLGIGGVLWGYIAAMALAVVVSLWGLKGKLKKSGVFGTRPLAAYAFRSTIYLAFLAVYGQLIFYLMGPLLAAEEIGKFSLLFKIIATGITVVPASVGLVLFPYFSQLNNDTAKTEKLLSSSLSVEAAIALVTSLAMFVFLGPFINVFFPSYSDGLVIAPFLIVGSFLLVISSTVDSFIRGRAAFGMGTISMALAIAILLAAGPVLISSHGIVGAAVTWLLGSIAMNGSFLFQIIRRYRLRFDYEAIRYAFTVLRNPGALVSKAANRQTC